MPTPATYKDIEALPEHLVGELINGELFISRRPPICAALAVSVLLMDLGNAFDRGRTGPGGWWMLREIELHFGQDVLVPNLTGWRHERLPTIPDVPYLELAPDWICEVLSPATAKLDLVHKLPKYAQAGVRHAWIVDPINHLLEVFRLEHEKWVLVSAFGGDDKVRAEPFEAVELELAALWTEEPPPSEP